VLVVKPARQERAGVSVGTLYQYFDGRRAILHALCRRHAAQMRALFVEHTSEVSGAPVAVAVPAFVDALAAAHALAPRLHLLDDPARLEDLGWRREVSDMLVRYLVP